MGDVREVPELPLQLIEVGTIPALQRLQRDDLLPLPVVHFVDDAHAAGADPPADGVTFGSHEAVGSGGVGRRAGGRRREGEGEGRDALQGVERDPVSGHQECRVLVERGGVNGGGEQRFDLDAGGAPGAALSRDEARPVGRRPGQGLGDDCLQPGVVIALHTGRPTPRLPTPVYASAGGPPAHAGADRPAVS